MLGRKKDKKEKKEGESKEEKFYRKLVGHDDVLFQQKVKWARDTKGKLIDAVAVVSPYRLFLVKDGLTGLGVDNEFSLLDILEIGGFGTDNFTVRYREKKNLQPTISVSTGSASTLIQIIRQAYRQITVGMPEDIAMKVSVPPQNLLQLQPLAVYGPAVGYVEAYRAFVDYFKKDSSFNNEVWYYIQERAMNSTELNVAEIPGVEAKSEVCVDIAPVCAALRYNTFFKSLIIDHVSRKDTVSAVAECVRNNRTLTKIAIRGEDSSERAFGDLCAALKENKRHTIMSLDFAHSTLGNRGTVMLSEAILGFSHGLQQLDISYSGLNDKLLTVLFQNFERSYGVSLTLEILNVAGNKFGEASSNSMSSWLVNMKEHSLLKRVNISATNANLLPIARGLRAMSGLTHLILANTKIDSQAALAVASIAEGSSTLKRLDVSGCSLSADSWGQIVNALLVNAKISAVEAIVGRNSDAGNAGESLRNAILKGGNLLLLDISEIHFREKQFLEILQALAVMKNLDSLVLDDCPRSNDNFHDIAQGLCDVIARSASIKSLSISGGFAKAIPKFLRDGVTANQSLHELNISDNKIGDEGVPYITEVIRKNQTIASLNLDGNHIGLNGWQAIRNALTKNATLVNIQYPVKDFDRILKDLPDSKKIVLRKVAYDLRLILNPAPVPRNTPSEIELPSSLIPLAPVPQYLAAIAAKIPPPDTTGLVKDEDRGEVGQLHPDSTYNAHERAATPEAPQGVYGSAPAAYAAPPQQPYYAQPPPPQPQGSYGAMAQPGYGAPPPGSYPPAAAPYPPSTPPGAGAYPAQNGKTYSPSSPTGAGPAYSGYPPAQPPGYPPPAAAPSGYPPPQTGYPPPQGGYPPPQTGYPPAPAGYAPPPQQPGYAPPQGGRQVPPQAPGSGFLGNQSMPPRAASSASLKPAPVQQNRSSGNLSGSYARDGALPSSAPPPMARMGSTQTYYPRDGVLPPQGAYPREGVSAASSAPAPSDDYPPRAAEPLPYYERDPSAGPPKRTTHKPM